ncbi:hypothetical protein VKT23_007726 [Stygiomarasmius scandens]|uniref:Uncharacterized protein n=1 Tax=Marasmiellus scandens TaxID=2682957 RepID=A0ABR1JI76_9AGAR
MSLNLNAVTIVLDDSSFPLSDCAFFLNLTSIGGPSLYAFAPYNGTFMVSSTNCTLSTSDLPRGTSIELYGFSPPAEVVQTFDVFLEEDQFHLSYPQAAVGDLWYSSPTTDPSAIQPEGITVRFDGPNLVFDYATVIVADFTSLEGQTILVDDSNSEIQWQGNWQQKTNYTLFNTGLNIPNVGPPTGHRIALTRPHGNGTHNSISVGDSMIFQFEGDFKQSCLLSEFYTLVGTSISVVGLSPVALEYLDPVNGVNSSDYHLSLNFTLDGKFTTVNFTEGNGLPHFTFFHADGLSTGDHILSMTVENNINSTVIIDYLTYKPSFPTLQDKPIFQPITPGTSSSTAVSPSPTSEENKKPSDKKVNTGAVVGGVVGGVLLLAVLALFIWFYRRKKKTSPIPEATQARSDLIIEPFVLTGGETTTTTSGKIRSPVVQSIQPSSKQANVHSSVEVSASSLLFNAEAVPSSPVEQHAALRRQRDELTETVHHLESQTGMDAPSNRDYATQDQIRDMHARIEMLTREMSRYLVPPAYNAGNGGMF